MKNLIKILFIILYIGVIVAIGLYYPVISLGGASGFKVVLLNLHPTDAIGVITTICQIFFFSTLILVMCISMSKIEKKEKKELFAGVVVCLGVILLIRGLGLALFGNL